MGIRTSLINRFLEPEGKEHLETTSIEEGSRIIYDQLIQDTPCMIARACKVELDAVIRYLSIKERSKYGLSFFWNFIGWNNKAKTLLSNNAGFFSNSVPNIERFCQLMIDCMSKVDVLGCSVKGENLLLNNFRQVKLIPLQSTEPFFISPSWNKALTGKKVLVIHPYSKSISTQYKKREFLFKDPNVLPEFELKTIKAVQSIAGEKVNFKDWFEALEHMKKQISETDFDIAIIGAGAYGFPLAAHVKDIGKKSVHMGGATQFMFGIKGKRWDDRADYNIFYNEHWIRPNENETPKNADQVEGGCYW
ncbi:hypothetical protein [Dysgonomonas sp. BGC7]|uniref:hypothetical protein n=1 Tax=Dysgonomonas sp. BGC7 TaxID=1658008 RepID=UPI000680A395|nr:hypothetical protein [Dysgonomonas sp. BGC7]MBD8389578.1 hypothetical protein [Dysgonomonas sp. BGC7]